MPCPANELGSLPPIRGGLRSAGRKAGILSNLNAAKDGYLKVAATKSVKIGAIPRRARVMWSAAACRRCLPSRLAGTCSTHQPRSIHRAMQARPGRASALNLLSTSIPNFSPQARQASPAIQRRQAAALHISCLGCDSTHVANQCHAHSGRSGHRQARTKKYRSPRRAFDARSYARRIRLLLRERGDA